MPVAAGLTVTIKPLPGISLLITVLDGTVVLQLTFKVANGVVLAGWIITVLLAVIEVVEALCVVVVAVKNPATDEPKAAGEDELDPTLPVLKSVAVNNALIVDVATVIAPVVPMENWSLFPA